VADEAGSGAELQPLLRERGYEPYADGDAVRLRNCPFHAVAQRHPEVVCEMNLALLRGVLAGRPGLTATLEPGVTFAVLSAAAEPRAANARVRRVISVFIGINIVHERRTSRKNVHPYMHRRGGLFYCSNASKAAFSITDRGADSPVQISNCRTACSTNISIPGTTALFCCFARRIKVVSSGL